MNTLNKKVHHPGFELAKLIRKSQITEKEFSEQTDIAFYRVWGFVNGKRKLTLKEIDRVALFTKTSPQYWRELQRNYYNKG